MHVKPWEGKLAEVEERRGKPKLRVITARPAGKGRPPQRTCPIDFDVIFVEIGRLDCETWYRASRITVNRWLAERGKQRLIRLRADFVKHQRVQARPAQAKVQVAPRRKTKIDPRIARLAAAHLRVRRHGGWMVSPTGQGEWWVGTKRMTPDALVAFASSKGFDVRAANLQVRAEENVGSEA